MQQEEIHSYLQKDILRACGKRRKLKEAVAHIQVKEELDRLEILCTNNSIKSIIKKYAYLLADFADPS